uniref:Nucleolar protein 8 n=1 Tax=Anas zonorhyncha TaxID=75864 RepID=A0A8B9VMM4_9AVES
VSVLNKAKWKGGTLQVELAKESFLHRLAMEREEARLQKEKTQTNDKMSLLESLKKAGVVDFHMKAVPGTEVPDHKNWVVGKFGRVLPILQLYCSYSLTKTNVVKYDPSKYCHNLRKLEQDLTHVVPVSKLTWYLEEKDDSISKKRQGEFPVTKKQPKKLRQLDSEGVNGSAAPPSGCWPHSKNISSSQLDQRSKTKSNEGSELLPSSSLYRRTPGRGSLTDKTNNSRISSQNNTMHVSDGDIDSEEEIRTMVKKGMERQQADIETEGDHLEIVGVNFELKYNTHWSLGNLDATKKVVKGNNKEKETVECDNGYDSADTDEIIAESKGSDPSSMKTAFLEDSKLAVVETKEILTNKKCDLANDSSPKTHRTVREGKVRKPKISALPSTTKTSDSESSYSESEKGESEISSDYESMMQNCYRLDLTLDDLKALATENSGTSVEELDNAQSSSQCSVKENAKGNVTCKTKLSRTPPAVKKKCISPEDIVAAILQGENNVDEESSKRHNGSCLKYQPFRGMRSLCEKELTKDSAGVKKSVESLGVKASIPYCGQKPSEGQSKNHPFYSLDISKENEQSEPCEQQKLSDESDPKTSGRLFESSEDEQDDTDDERFKIKPQFEGKAGEKLLNLQSRFGTDERFRMDARFLESDSEEEGRLVQNHRISRLEETLRSSSPTSDLTLTDHVVFERKPDTTEKESKAKRKKKREESEKLPEVSKEIYYDIAVDLKELFGSSKSKPEKREEIPWDKDNAEESTPHDNLGPDDGSNTAQNSGGFKFSFFDDVDQSHVKEGSIMSREDLRVDPKIHEQFHVLNCIVTIET